MGLRYIHTHTHMCTVYTPAFTYEHVGPKSVFMSLSMSISLSAQFLNITI